MHHAVTQALTFDVCRKIDPNADGGHGLQVTCMPACLLDPLHVTSYVIVSPAGVDAAGHGYQRCQPGEMFSVIGLLAAAIHSNNIALWQASRGVSFRISCCQPSCVSRMLQEYAGSCG